MRSELYDTLVIVLLDEEYRVTEGLRMTKETFKELAGFSRHINSWTVTVSQKLRVHPDVEILDLSDAFLDVSSKSTPAGA
jgi:hypothetical protein